MIMQALEAWFSGKEAACIRHGSEFMKKLQRQDSEWQHVADYIVLLNSQRVAASENYVVIEYYAAA